MSYILDALRRAEAERERGEVPGLQSQQHAMLDDDDAPPRSKALIWVIVGLVLALAAAIAWNFLGGEPPRSAPMAAAPVVAVPPPAVVAVAPSIAAPPQKAASAAMSPASAVIVATAPPPAAVEPKRPAPARRATPAPSADAAGHTSGSKSATSSPAPRPASDDRVYAYAELPDAVRRDIPKLAFGGSSYSGSATSRMVILNGQVFHEGDTIAPGLKLRQIKPKAAVLSFKDTRFELSY